LKRNLHDSELWLRVAAKMPPSIPYIAILGSKRSRERCFVEALERCPDRDKPTAWACLAAMFKTEVWDIGGRKCHLNTCFLNLLGLKTASNAEIWLRLAHFLKQGYLAPFNIDGKVSGFLECLIFALESPDPPADAWIIAAGHLCKNNVGRLTVHGRQYCRHECLEEAVRIDPNDGRTWMSLASADTVTINGVPHTRAQCYQKAIECNPGDSAGWLGLTLCYKDLSTSFEVSGVKYDLPKCREKAIRAGITDPMDWCILKELSAKHQLFVGVDGVEYDEAMCDMMAATLVKRQQPK
jgi:hypothetical protein